MQYIFCAPWLPPVSEYNGLVADSILFFDNTGAAADTWVFFLGEEHGTEAWDEHSMWNRTCQLGVMENLFVQIYQCGQAGVEVSLASERVTGVRVTQVQCLTGCVKCLYVEYIRP